MRRLYGLLVALVAVARVVPAAPAPAVDDLELALHWAPVHHQDTDDTHAGADYITTVDYDGAGTPSTTGSHQRTIPAG